jgi:hypothetical protein
MKEIQKIKNHSRRVAERLYRDETMELRDPAGHDDIE